MEHALTPLYAFKSDTDGVNASIAAVDAQGTVYGFTLSGGGGTGDSCNEGGCGTIFKVLPSGEKIVLRTFNDGFDHKGARVSSMVLDGAGNIFGTTINGGYGNRGTVFKLAPDGTFTVLHTFNESHMTGGLYPLGGIIFGHDGNLYGTTWQGGLAGTCGGLGCGTVFRITPQGALTTLYAFKGAADACWSWSGLTSDAAGNLYGTTSGNCGHGNFGAVFKLAPDGTESILHRFRNGDDGSLPASAPVIDAAGNLYGGTVYGGGTGCGGVGPGPGCGVIYKIASDGTYSILYAFKGGTKKDGQFLRTPGDGGGASSKLFLDGKGNLYGVTTSGGASDICNAPWGCGTIFKLRPDGKETVLHRFIQSGDGGFPGYGLVPGSGENNGTFYGATGIGSQCCAVVFKIEK